MTESLLTPIFLADGSDPGEHAESRPRVYYVLASNGLFLVREHAFFRSCVPAPAFPSELAEHDELFEPRFPKIPQALFESIVGFFAAVARAHGAEAGVLLYWDREKRRVHALAPPQTATISGSWRGYGYPVGLHYEIPERVDPNWIQFGDVHSHAALPAYASATDQHDETQSPGLHVVVGRVHDEPPAFHVEAVVDEQRFPLTLAEVVEGYERRRPFPGGWVESVRVMNVAEFERERDLASVDRGVAEDLDPRVGSVEPPPASGGAHEQNGAASHPKEGEEGIDR